MPVLFVGHGSPTNIVADNAYTRDLKKLAGTLPRPDAILVVSAHWLRRGTYVTGAARPPQIYDFYGFPEELSRVTYEPAGSPALAASLHALDGNSILIDPARGIDHAAWAVLVHMYPKGDIPVVEVSLHVQKDAAYHYALGQRLTQFRDQGILIIGSGNIVHNLHAISFEEDAPPYSWAVKFDTVVKERLLAHDDDALIHYERHGPLSANAIPTNDHYLPMVSVLGMRTPEDRLRFFHESIQNGSVSMRSFILE
jgi:4,5-DOPA dioxygenase extradiol